MSFSSVSGFIATTRSRSPGRAFHPSALTRISYQVGSPWMFDGKMFFPGDRNAHAENGLHEHRVRDADPVPLTVPILKAKSLMEDGRWKMEDLDMVIFPPLSGSNFRSSIFHLPSLFANAYGITSSNFLISHAAVGHRSAHSPQCRHRSSSFTITRFVCGSASLTKISCDMFVAGAESRVRRSASSPAGAIVMQFSGQMSTHASHSMQSFSSKCVSMSQLRQRCTSRAVCSGVKPSSTSTFTAEKRFTSSSCVIFARGDGL